MRALLDVAIYLMLLLFSAAGSAYLFLAMTGAESNWASILKSSAATLSASATFVLLHLFFLVRYGKSSHSDELDWEQMIGGFKRLALATAVAIVFGATIAWAFPAR